MPEGSPTIYLTQQLYTHDLPLQQSWINSPQDSYAALSMADVPPPTQANGRARYMLLCCRHSLLLSSSLLAISILDGSCKTLQNCKILSPRNIHPPNRSIRKGSSILQLSIANTPSLYIAN